MTHSETLTRSSEKDLLKIIRLRLSVGFLGEKEQHDWWPSLWLTANSTAFLSPIYGERLDTACYQGVVEAARRVHDQRIGVGRAFHLFRLPEGLERALHEAVANDLAGEVRGDLNTSTAALGALTELSSNSIEASPGPVRAGDIASLNGRKWIGVLAAYYKAAFDASQQTFPYFSEYR